MIIVAGGDSFTLGIELADQVQGRPSSLAIPAILARNSGLHYECVALGGNANSAIARQVMDYCEQQDTDMFVYVMWTFLQRYEFRFSYDTGRKNSPWLSINSWDVEDIDKVDFNKTAEGVNIFLKNKQILESSGVADFAKSFYKHIGNSEYWELYTTLKEIVFLESYLKNKRIPYMFTSSDVYLENSSIYKNHQADISIKTLYNQIDWNRWYSFPAGTNGKDQTLAPRGFYQWAVENKYPVGITHPLEQAHQDAAILMQEKFNELVKKSIQ